jgi:hypothetical protein
VKICRYINDGILFAIAFFIFVVPAAIDIRDLSDPGIRSAAIPQSAWRLHKNLSPKYERWALTRLNSSRAGELSTSNISGTEWPLFGSVFYLWATESLQDAWDEGYCPGSVAPKTYAKNTIEAAARLVIDPGQANWVKIHWGTNYLKTENVFYRMLVISALTSHFRLTGDSQFLPLLKDQADSLAAELDASPHGLLDDYPAECYPGDVLTSIAMIRRADKVLGTDHSVFVHRALRGFQGQAQDPRGLVPYSAAAQAGIPTSPTRGCGNSYVSLFSPEIWPEQGRKWYDLYAHHFWQKTWTCAGFREFPKDIPGKEWYVDVDAGPVLKGFGCSACAFGVGAARVNGHFEHAYPLTAEMLVTSWPLPDGTRLLARMLSNATDAPYLGEAAVLFNLTRLPSEGTPVATGGSIPGFVIIFLTLQLGVGLILIASALNSLRRWRKHGAALVVPRPRLQIAAWICLMLAAAGLWLLGKLPVAMLFLACAQLLPRSKRTKSIFS